MALTNAEIQQVLDAIAALGKKIPSLTQAGTLDGTEELEGVKDSATVKMTTAQIAGLINGNGPEGFAPINNLNAVAAPTATDDSSDGYSVGSLWGFGDNIYKCTDATEGAAVWVVYLDSLVDTTFTPTVSGETNGTLAVSNFKIKRVGDICTFSFSGQFTLGAGQTGGDALIDLPSLFQPSSNWSSDTQVVTVLNRNNDIFTAECYIQADTGSKLLSCGFNDTTAAVVIRFSAIGEYVLS
jgi:hypothetical protein